MANLFLDLRNSILSLLFIFAILGGITAVLFGFPPNDFPKEETVRIVKGSTLSETAQILFEKKIIRSPFWFKVIVTLGDSGVIAGDYYFEKPQGLAAISKRLIVGDGSFVPIRITVPEGLSVSQIAELFSNHFSLFDEKLFVEIAPEGFLFPDTYFFFPNISAEDAIERMRLNFEERTKELKNESEILGKNWEDIVNMASIIEREAKHEEDRAIISGILWKRIDIGMALQVDAAFYYVNGKNTYTLSLEDLGEESPYNTYRNTGLPPTPIANPGLASIKASIYPVETEYLYFLSDLAGNMYYAEDFDGHQRNRELYLRR